MALGALALFNQVSARVAERRYPPRGSFVWAGGQRLHYLRCGSGPALVLVHGNGAMAEDFAASGLMDRLAAAGYSVIAIDRPGFGHSPRPRHPVWTADRQAALLLQALRALGVERPVVVGHSWGTLVALAMALRGEVSALVLLSGFVLPQPRPDVLGFVPTALPVLGDVLNHTLMPPLSRMALPALFRRIFAPCPVSPGFRAGFPAALAVRPRQLRASAADTALMIPSAAMLAPRYGQLALPISILAGTEDRMVRTSRQSVALHRLLPHSTLRLLPGAGHMVHHTHLSDVADAIVATAREAQAAGRAAQGFPPGPHQPG